MAVLLGVSSKILVVLDEGRSWGMTERAATRTVSETAEAIRNALDVVDPVLPHLRALIATRLGQLTPDR